MKFESSFLSVALCDSYVSVPAQRWLSSLSLSQNFSGYNHILSQLCAYRFPKIVQSCFSPSHGLKTEAAACSECAEIALTASTRLAGEAWELVNSCFKIAGAVLIIAGNYAYFELRAQAKAAAAAGERPPSPPVAKT